MNKPNPNPVHLCWSLAAAALGWFAWSSLVCVTPEIEAAWIKGKVISLLYVALFALLAIIFEKRMGRPAPAPLPLRLLIAAVLIYGGILVLELLAQA